MRDAPNVYYQEVLVNLAEALRTHISSAPRLTHFDQSIPLVLSGGTAMPKGFLDHFHEGVAAAQIASQAFGSARLG